MVRMILYVKAALIGGRRTTLFKGNWVSLISANTLYVIQTVLKIYIIVSEI